MKVKGLTALLLLTAASLSSAQSRQDLLLEQKREKAERLVEESVSRSEKRIRALENSRFPKNIFVKGFHGVRPLIGGMPSGSGAVAGIGYVRGLDYELVNIEANARYSMALVVQTSGTAHAVELYNPGASTLRVLSSGMEPYSGLSWRDDSDDLAVLRGENAEGFEAPAHTLLAWKGLDGETTEYSFGDSDVEEFPASMRIVEHRRPFWSLAGDRVFLGIAERRAKDELEEETSAADAETVTEDEDDDEVAEEPADVEVWHSSDERIVAMQRVRKQDDRKANLLAAWNFDTRRFTRIGTDVHETVDVLEGGLYAVETKRAAYRFDNMFDRPRHDLVLVDAASGERRSIANGVRYGVEGSATGNYVLFFYEESLRCLRHRG